MSIFWSRHFLCSRTLPRVLVTCTRTKIKGPKAIDTSAPDYIAPKRWYEKKYHEPEYLDLLKPQIPFYDLINVQIYGYDFAIVEEYVRFVQKIGKNLDIKLVKYWALPATELKFDTYQDRSSIIEETKNVKIYTRVIQMKHVTTKQLPLLIDVMQSRKPVGVTFHIKEHVQEDEDNRYMEDTILSKLQAELEEWKKPISVLGSKLPGKK